MKLTITRIDKTLPLPTYQTAGAAAVDLISRETMTIAPKTLGFIPTNLIITVPNGYMLVVVPRSSTPRKKGLLIPHGIGIIDQDFCGPNDEILFQIYNFTEQDVIVERGERIGQAVLVKIDRMEWNEVETSSSPSRGGFGSTG